MSLRLSCLAIGTAMSLMTAASGQVFVGHVMMNDSYGPNPGGEFRGMTQPDFTFVPGATGTGFQFGLPAAPGLFETFCLEAHELLDFEVGAFRADLNVQTTAGSPGYAGGAMGGINDPLDARTAYLYHHFIYQSLITPYDYATEAVRIDDATALQAAIWFIEEESSDPLAGKALLFFNEANAAVNAGSWTGLGDVRVLNLYQVNNGVRTEFQDVLVIIPAPGAGLALGMGALLAARRRR
jgi:hypothetical protein